MLGRRRASVKIGAVRILRRCAHSLNDFLGRTTESPARPLTAGGRIPPGKRKMAKSVKALINPAILAWAREQAGFSPDEAARRLHIDADRLAALEKGDETPTFAKT